MDDGFIRLIAEFEKNCADAGHYWSDHPTGLGEYCQGCGDTRPFQTSVTKQPSPDCVSMDQKERHDGNS